MLNDEDRLVIEEVQSMKEDLKELNKSIQRVERKVFNGFGSRIDAVKDNLDKEIKTNAIAHDELKESIKGLAKFIATALIAIFIAIVGVLGAVWSSDTRGQARIEQALINLEQQYREDIKDANSSTDILIEVEE